LDCGFREELRELMMRGKVERNARNRGSKRTVCEGEVCGGVENGGLGLAGFAEDL
jgi:hypothetical protein